MDEKHPEDLLQKITKEDIERIIEDLDMLLAENENTTFE